MRPTSCQREPYEACKGQNDLHEAYIVSTWATQCLHRINMTYTRPVSGQNVPDGVCIGTTCARLGLYRLNISHTRPLSGQHETREACIG
jgi:hypothetical protein